MKLKPIHSSRLIGAIVLLVMGASLQAPATGEEASSLEFFSGATCPDDGANHSFEQREIPNGTDVVNCDLAGEVVVVNNGLSISIPPIGHAVSLNLDLLGEEFSESRTFATDSNGFLTISNDTGFSESGPGEDNADPIPACNDDKYDPSFRGEMVRNEPYYIKLSTIPSRLNQGDVISAIVRSMDAWGNAFNDCGIPDKVSNSAEYRGNIAANSSVQADGCVENGTGPSDTTSVVSFGPLNGFLGYTCRYSLTTSTGGTQVYGSDIRLNEAVNYTLTPNFNSCSNQIDLQSVMTHEAGHWFGLNDIDRDEPMSGGGTRIGAHNRLTMRAGGKGAVTCNDALRTLAKGDVRGMEVLYLN